MGLFDFYKKDAEKDHEEVVKSSLTKYQIKEYNGEIWLTYDGELVCPCSMLNTEPVNAVETMRELYIERTPKLPRL